MINFRMLRYSDMTIWICVIALILFSFLMIFSATYSSEQREGGDPWYYLKKQFIALIIGLIGMAYFCYIDYSNLKGIPVALLYVLALTTLLLVLFKGYVALGAQRWLSLGPVSFQPSELSKLVVLLGLANYLASKTERIVSFIQLTVPLIIAGIPFVLIFRQPDLGTSIVLMAILLGMLMWADVSGLIIFLLMTPMFSLLLVRNVYLWTAYMIGLFLFLFLKKIRIIDSVVTLALNLGVGFIIPRLWGMLKDYQKNRILAFINPEIDPLGAGYHSMQVKIAVGSGGFFGKGFFNGTQTQFSFIPQQFTDFIFSVGGEEFGFIGGFIIILLLFMIVFRAITIAKLSRDFHGSLLAIGFAIMIGFHAAVNIGMTLGLIPVVGIPLPFLSYGGTALVLNLVSVGILQSIYMRRQKLLF